MDVNIFVKLKLCMVGMYNFVVVMGLTNVFQISYQLFLQGLQQLELLPFSGKISVFPG